MPKPPTFVGMPPDTKDPVANYRKGVAERAAAQRQHKPPVPNLAQADVQFDPRKDQPVSLAQIAQSQKSVREVAEPPTKDGILSSETIAGLQALKAAVEKQQNVSTQPPKEQPSMQQAQPTPVAPEAPPQVPSANKDEVARERLNELDEFELEKLLRSIQTDVINNESERKEIEKRVKPIDLTEGLSTGQFTQDVPIVPDRLTVRYRTVTSLENQSIRILLAKHIQEDPRREAVASELYGLMQTVASVVRINTNQLPPHMVGQDMYSSEFDESVFLHKFKLFQRYPLPMLHAIGVHGFWFDRRVREAFTATALKNG